MGIIRVASAISLSTILFYGMATRKLACRRLIQKMPAIWKMMSCSIPMRHLRQKPTQLDEPLRTFSPRNTLTTTTSSFNMPFKCSVTWGPLLFFNSISTPPRDTHERSSASVQLFACKLPVSRRSLVIRSQTARPTSKIATSESH